MGKVLGGRLNSTEYTDPVTQGIATYCRDLHMNSDKSRVNKTLYDFFFTNNRILIACVMRPKWLANENSMFVVTSLSPHCTVLLSRGKVPFQNQPFLTVNTSLTLPFPEN